MFVSSRTKNALRMTQYECCYKMTKTTTTTTCLTFFPDILHLTIIPRVSVGHELAIIISYQICASGVSGGKGERWKRKRKTGEGKKRLTQMLLLEPSTPTQHDSKPSNQNHIRSLGCQLHVSKSSPKINLTIRSGRAPVLVLLRFRFF